LAQRWYAFSFRLWRLRETLSLGLVSPLPLIDHGSGDLSYGIPPSRPLAGDFRTLPCNYWRSLQDAVRTLGILRSAGIICCLDFVEVFSSEMNSFWAAGPSVMQTSCSISRLYANVVSHIELFKNDLQLSSQGWSSPKCVTAHTQIFLCKYAILVAELNASVLAALPANSNLQV
jgi:hypothetical protein